MRLSKQQNSRPWRRIEKLLVLNACLLLLLVIGTFINNRQARKAVRDNNRVQMQILQVLDRSSGNQYVKKIATQISTEGLAYLGSPKAPVKMIMIADFECPFCEQVGSKYLKDVRKDFVDTGLLGIYFLNDPLTSHVRGQEAALAGWAAHQQGKFWAFYDTMSASGDLSPDGYTAAAASLGLDSNRFTEDFKSTAAATEIKRQIALAESVPVPGVPALVLHDELLIGEQGFAGLKDRLTEWFVSQAQVMTQAEFAKMPVQERPAILDVRRAEEIAQGAIPGSLHATYGTETFLEDARNLLPSMNQPILVYCKGGARSAKAWHLLRGEGYTNVQYLSGGYDAWKAAQ